MSAEPRTGAAATHRDAPTASADVEAAPTGRPGPVFITGVACSGKTPLRIALDAHPRLALTRRTTVWADHDGRYGDLADAANLERCLTALFAEPGVAALGVDRNDVAAEFARGPATYPRLYDVVLRLHAERLGKRRWGVQAGGLERDADRLLSAHPDARIIHMVRDPRTWYAAVAGTRRARPGRLRRQIARWRDAAALAIRNAQRHPRQYRIVRYEALCAEPEAALREVTAFLGEDDDPAMLAALTGTTLDDHERRAALAPWVKRRVAASVRRHAASEMTALGYAVTTVLPEPKVGR